MRELIIHYTQRGFGPLLSIIQSAFFSASSTEYFYYTRIHCVHTHCWATYEAAAAATRLFHTSYTPRDPINLSTGLYGCNEIWQSVLIHEGPGEVSARALVHLFIHLKAYSVGECVRVFTPVCMMRAYSSLEISSTMTPRLGT